MPGGTCTWQMDHRECRLCVSILLCITAAQPRRALLNVQVMKDSAEKSKGFGFVCFTNPEDATKAVTEESGKMFKVCPA